MWNRVLLSVSLAFSLGVCATAQLDGLPSSPVRGSFGFPNDNSARSRRDGVLFLSGKVVVDDGTPLNDHAAIQSICAGRSRIEGYSDRTGAFSFEVHNSAGLDKETNASGSFLPGIGSSLSGPLEGCELAADVPGFVSSKLMLAANTIGSGVVYIGTIMLHRAANVEGFTMSATSAAAPGKAKKDYEKGREYLKKGQWQAAQEKFQQAVDAHPKYAESWVELGRVELRQGNVAGAREALHQAVVADSKLIPPYEALAKLAVQERQWKELADTTDQILKLNPVSFPQYWYLNAVANYCLRRFDLAERSALRGLDIDAQHRVPKLEYVLGLVLLEQHEPRGAAEHIRSFLRLTQNSADTAFVQQQLEELEKLSSQAR